MVEYDGYALRLIPPCDQTEQICFFACSNWGYAIRWAKYQTPRVQEAAVRQNGGALFLIDHPTPRVRLIAVRREPSAIRHVPYDDQTNEMIRFCFDISSTKPRRYVARP